MRFIKRSLVGLFLVAVTGGLLVWAGATIRAAVEARMAREGGARPAEERVFAADVLTVEPATIAPVLTAFGEVRSRRTLEVRAAATGRVLELSPGFEDGGTVAAGELLVALDPREAEAALAVARADLAEAEAGVADAARERVLAAEDLASAEAQLALQARALDRARQIATRGIGSDAAVETAELAQAQAAQAVVSRRQALAQAEALTGQSAIALERAAIALAEAERTLAETRIGAAFAGTLSDIAAVEGGLVSANERLARLIDPQALEVSFRLSTAQYARLVGPDGRLVGAAVEAALDAAEDTADGAVPVARGMIRREGGAVAEGQTGRLLFAALDAPAGLRPGDFVTVRVTEPALEGVALLPAAAVDGNRTVLALGPDDRLEVLPVEVLRRQGNEVIVAAGALAGREVVAERSPFLGAGIRVRPLRGAGATAATTAGEAMIALTPERRAALIALVEGSDSMPAEAKARALAQLAAGAVPAGVVARIEARAGG